MTVASSGQGPKGCKVLSLGPLIKGRTPLTQSSPSLSSLHPRGVSRMIPGLQTVKYTCFYGPDPLPISLTLSSVSAHSRPSYTHSDPLQSTFLHPNLIVTSYLTPKPLMGSPPHPPSPLPVPHNKCMQKGGGPAGVGLLFLHGDADHTGMLFQVSSWIHNSSPR